MTRGEGEKGRSLPWSVRTYMRNPHGVSRTNLCICPERKFEIVRESAFYFSAWKIYAKTISERKFQFSGYSYLEPIIDTDINKETNHTAQETIVLWRICLDGRIPINLTLVYESS